MKTRQAVIGFMLGLIVLASGSYTCASGLDIMETGTIGGIKLGATEAEIHAAIGDCQAKLLKGEDEIWGVDGLAHQEWIFPETGLSLDMLSDTIAGPKTASSITISTLSALKTGRGIGIGSPKADVLKAYAGFHTEADEARNFNDNQEYRHLVGSVYGGMIFSFTAGKVSGIFFGAAAE